MLSNLLLPNRVGDYKLAKKIKLKKFYNGHAYGVYKHLKTGELAFGKQWAGSKFSQNYDN